MRLDTPIHWLADSATAQHSRFAEKRDYRYTGSDMATATTTKQPQLRILWIATCAVCLITAGCGGDDGPADTQDTVEDIAQDRGDVPPDTPEDSGDDADTGTTTGPPDPLPPSAECDGLIPWVCAMPWPSNNYLVEDAERETGYEVRFGENSLPSNVQGVHMDAARFSHFDGYPLSTSAVLLLPYVDISELPTEYNTTQSLLPDADIVWLKVNDDNSVARVPYWVEEDLLEPDPGRRALYIRPAIILEPDTNYIVALRNMVDTNGDPIRVPDTFARLRDNDTTGDPLLEGRQARFDRMFDLLEEVSVERDQLTIAWDFNTASESMAQEFRQSIRSRGLAASGSNGPELIFNEVREFTAQADSSGLPVDPNIWFVIEGLFFAPNYLVESEAGEHIGSLLSLDENGDITQNGYDDSEFTIIVPQSARTGLAHQLMQFGHDGFNNHREVAEPYVAQLANKHRYIAFGSSLLGYTDYDLNGLVRVVLSDLNYFWWIGDQLNQALLEFELLARSLINRTADLQDILPTAIPLAIDRTQIFYYGLSTGGTWGISYAALNPDVRRAHLLSPGIGWPNTIERSFTFGQFLQNLLSSYPNRYDHAVGIQLVAMIWDSTAPENFLRQLRIDPPEGSEETRLQIVVTKGNRSTPTVGIESATRSRLGISLASSYSRTVPGAEVVDLPNEGSTVILYDYGNAWPPGGNVPPPDDGLEDPDILPLNSPKHDDQIHNFFQTGIVSDLCGGQPCDGQ